MQQHRSKYFARGYTPDPGGGVKRSKHFFSESSHVAYQIKGNGVRASCKHIFCPYTHPEGQNIF